MVCELSVSNSEIMSASSGSDRFCQQPMLSIRRAGLLGENLTKKRGPRQHGNGNVAMLDLSKSAQACAELLDVDCATAIAVKLVEGLAKVFHLLTTPVSSRHRR